jgi:GNAT superfamily N-acetyltransferase
MIIRKAIPKDYSAVITLYHELDQVYSKSKFKHNPDLDISDQLGLVEKMSEDRSQQIWVAEASCGEIIATVTIVYIPCLFQKGHPIAAVDNVVVKKEFRDKGIGGAIMEYAKNECLKQGCSSMILSSNLAREKAHSFYKKNGWQESHWGYAL